MKLYRLFILILALYGNVLSAQQNISVKKISELNGISSGFRPVFISDKSIVYTDELNNALFLYDIKKKSALNLCDDIGSGDHFIISDDGKNIAYKSYKMYEYGRRQSSVYIIDIETKVKKTIIQDVRELSSLDFQNGNLSFIHQQFLKEYSLNPEKKLKNGLLAFTDANLNLVAVENSKQNIINPLGKGNYIWVSVSPDGTKILFTKTGKGTFICNSKGEDIINLGRLHAAKWSKDGKWIIGMNDFDNGHKYTNSQIIMISPDGKNRQILDLKNIKIALYPDLSSDNSNVVFNTETGKIYILKLKYR